MPSNELRKFNIKGKKVSVTLHYFGVGIKRGTGMTEWRNGTERRNGMGIKRGTERRNGMGIKRGTERRNGMGIKRGTEWG